MEYEAFFRLCKFKIGIYPIRSKSCGFSIKEIPYTTDSNLNKNLGVYTSNGSLIASIGKVNLLSGYFKFDLNIQSYLSAKNYIGIRCNLVNDDIKTTKNQILTIDSSMNSSISKNDNLVLVENYAN